MLPESYRSYHVKIRITDKQQKSPTGERKTWTENVEANDFPDKSAAELSVLEYMFEKFSPKTYNIEVLSINEKTNEIPKLIVPE